MFVPKNSLAEKISDTKSKVDKVLKEDVVIAVSLGIVGIFILLPSLILFSEFLEKIGIKYRLKSNDLRRDLQSKVIKILIDYNDNTQKLFPPLNNILNDLDKNPDKKIFLEKWNQFSSLFSSLNNNLISDLQSLLTNHPLIKRWFTGSSAKEEIVRLKKQLNDTKEESAKILNDLNSKIMNSINDSDWITIMITFIKQLIIAIQKNRRDTAIELDNL